MLIEGMMIKYHNVGIHSTPKIGNNISASSFTSVENIDFSNNETLTFEETMLEKKASGF